MAAHNLNKKGDFNSINTDTMTLDTREGHEYDNDDTILLDIRVKPEYDKAETFPLSPSDHDTPSCHSGPRAGIQRDNKLMPKAFRFAQSGRSMVEMLGVLAVIGVLSIGGIAGYSYGMDKYRANETTNQIMLRAIDLMTQAGNENETLSLSAWNNESSQYDFGEVGFTHDDLIYMDVGTQNKLPKRVCEIVYDAMKDMAVQIDIDATRADSNDTCGDDNEMTFYFEGTNNYTCDPSCPEGQYCDNGICFKGGMPEGTGITFDKECTSSADCNTDWTGTCSYCENNKCHGYVGFYGDLCTIKEGNISGQCYAGECVVRGCTTNADCKEPGTFCASTNNSNIERFQNGEIGACAPLDFIKREISGEIYYISNTLLSWWDAEYACEAIGKNIGKTLSLLDSSDSEVIIDGVDLTKELDAHIWRERFCSMDGYCYVGNQTCAPCNSSGSAFAVCH